MGPAASELADDVEFADMRRATKNFSLLGRLKSDDLGWDYRGRERPVDVMTSELLEAFQAKLEKY
jgi:hypothetical protein